MPNRPGASSSYIDLVRASNHVEPDCTLSSPILHTDSYGALAVNDVSGTILDNVHSNGTGRPPKARLELSVHEIT